MLFIRRLCFALAFVGLSSSAYAQTMFKCTQADGKIAFQAEPCPDNANEQVLKASKRGEVKVVQPTTHSASDENANATPPVGVKSTDTATSNIAPDTARPDVARPVASAGNDASAPAATPKSSGGIFQALLMMVAFCSLGASVLAHFWLLLVIFGESLMWGLASLCIPGVYLLFVITHWKKAKGPFLIGFATALAPVFWFGVFDSASKHHVAFNDAQFKKPAICLVVDPLPVRSVLA